MRTVLTPHAPGPGGCYSQAVVHGGMVYVAGQLPIDPAKGPAPDPSQVGTIEEQTRQAMRNLEAVLKASGSSLSRVIKTTVYIADVSTWARVNAVYAEFFPANPPARSTIPCGLLHFGYQVEIDAIAALDEGAP